MNMNWFKKKEKLPEEKYYDSVSSFLGEKMPNPKEVSSRIDALFLKKAKEEKLNVPTAKAVRMRFFAMIGSGFAAFAVLLVSVWVFRPDLYLPVIRLIATPQVATVQMQGLTFTDYGVDPNVPSFALQIGKEMNERFVATSVKITPAIEFTTSLSPDKKNIIVTPKDALQEGINYSVELKPGIVFQDGSYLASAQTWVIPVRSKFAIIGITPTNGSEAPFTSAIEVLVNRDNISVDDFRKAFSVTPAIKGSVEKRKGMFVFIPEKQLMADGTYTVTVAQSLSTENGETLSQGAVSTFSVMGSVTNPDGNSVAYQGPRLNFPVKVMNMNQNQFSVLEATGMSKVVMTYYKVSTDRIQGIMEQYAKDGQVNWTLFTKDAEVTKTQTIAPSSGAFSFTTNDLALGMYIVKAASQDGNYAVHQVILKSGVGSYAVVEQNSDKTNVWVMDYGVFGTVNGADVSAYSCSQSGCTQLSSVTTAENGYAQLKAINESGYVITKYKEGVSLVAFGSELTQIAGSNSFYRGSSSHLFGDIQLSKPFYAPGETVKYAAYIRERKNGDTLPPTNPSLKVAVCPPQALLSDRDYSKGCTISLATVSTEGKIAGEFSALGRGVMQVAILEEPQSGVYETVVSETFMVMTAETPRYVISGDIGKETFLAGETITLSGRLTDYAGNGISNQSLTLNVWLSPVTIDPKKSGAITLDTVTYGANGNSLSKGNIQVKTDSSGNYKVNVPITEKDLSNFLYRASISLSLQQGESSTAIEKNILVGKKVAYKVLAQQEGKDIAIAQKSIPATIRLQAATLFSGDFPEDHKATISVTRKWTEKVENGKVYNPVTKQVETRYKFEQRTETVLPPKQGIFGSKGEYAFELKDLKAGTYTVFVTNSDGTSGSFDAFTVSESQITAGATERITSFGFSTTSAKPGEKISLLLAHTFKDAKRKLILLTMTDTINSWKFVDVSAETIQFEVTREMVGGVKACLVYPMQVIEQNGNALEALGGAIDDSQCSYLPVEDPDQKLKLAIYTDKTAYEPGKEANIFVEVTDQSGKPVSATVGLTIVDSALKAALEVNEFWADDTYATFYQSLRINFPYGRSAINYNQLLSKGYGDFGGLGSGAGNSSAIRKNFTDNPFWSTTVTTDNEGKAKVSLTLPDGITQWTTKAWAITSKTQTGVQYATFTTTKNAYISFETPSYVRQGDTWSPVITVVNTEDKAFSGTMSASCAVCMDVPSVVSVSVPPKSSAQYSFPVTFKSASPAVLDIQLKRSESIVDAVAKTVTVRPIDVTQQKVSIFRLTGDASTATLQLPEKLVPEQSTAVITLNKYPFSADDLVVDPEVSTTEGIAGALIAAISVLNEKDARNEGISDAYISQRVTNLLFTLLQRQQENGGFGQFSYDSTTLRTSAYAAIAIADASQNSILRDKISDATKKNLATYIVTQIRSANQSQGDTVWGLYGLGMLDKQVASPLITSMYATRAERKLTLDELSVLAMALHSIGAQADAMTISTELAKEAVKVSESAYLVPFNTPTVSQSFTAFIMSKSVLSDAQKEQLSRLQQWLMTEDIGAPSNTFDFYISKLSLLGSFENTIFNSVPFRAEVLVNGNRVGEVSYKGGEEQMTVSTGILRSGSNDVTLKVARGKHLFVSVKVNAVTTGDIKEFAGSVDIKREVVNVTRPGKAFIVGDIGYVKMILTPKAQTSSLQVKEYLPAGIVPASYRADMSVFWEAVKNNNATVLFGDIRVQDYVGTIVTLKNDQKSTTVMYPFIAVRKGKWGSGIDWITPGNSGAIPTVVKVPQIVVE
jgi:uncharacterized protein YfaS (alpha-2-macroglobulin family)